jgi:hypothetical protein
MGSLPVTHGRAVMLIQEMRLRDADVFVFIDIAVFLDDAKIWRYSSLTKLPRYIVPKD